MDTAAAAAAAAGEDVASSLCGDYKRHLPSPHPPAVAPRLLLVRHGERADEVRGVSISEADRDLPYYDPPLTQKGHLQAADAGKRLSRVAGIAQARIFASPTIRTVETAAGIARQLDLPVVLVPQLADCAMGCQDGGGVVQEAGEGATGPTDQERLDRSERRLRDGSPLLTTAALRARCPWAHIMAGPSHPAVKHGHGHRPQAISSGAAQLATHSGTFDGDASFLHALRAIYDTLERKGVPLGIVVTHREGIRCILEQRVHIDYCAVYEAAVDAGTGAWKSWKLQGS